MNKLLLIFSCVAYARASGILTGNYGLPLGHSTYGVPSKTSILFREPVAIIDRPHIGHETYGIPVKYAHVVKEPLTVFTNPDDIVDAKFIEEDGHIVSKVESLNQKFRFQYPDSLYSVYPHSSVHYREHHHPIFTSLPYPSIAKPSIEVLPPIETSPILSKPVEILPEVAIEIPEKRVLDSNKQYHSGYILDNGTKVVEEGKIISTQNGWENVVAKRGSYEYISPEGIPVKVKWVADEKGFRLE